ncbi:MAG TPA: DUF72 domain-containing protein [Acidimicrobiales bacterium]|nr:DUF72 domain-containing protein [Acidimicrobiales bacterium]
MAVLVGTSGWQYDHWKGTFYPPEVPKARWLEHYAERFATVESNSAFYRLPERRTFADWASRTPDDFVIAVKASRYLTHVRRLRDPRDPVLRLAGRLEGLGDCLGPVLLQLPPTLRVDAASLTAALKTFPRSVRVAVEPRHPSWFTDEIRAILERNDAALCLSDRRGPLGPPWRTATWGYVRFHEGRASPNPCYGRAALATWADRVRSLWGPSEAVYCYFNNDPVGCAPRDARRFALAVRGEGRRVTRVPGARELKVGAP